MNRQIHMVDVGGQYRNMKSEIDQAVIEVIESGQFINGPKVKGFQADLENFLEVKHVIPCANGTDALQIALMALGLEPGDEVIVPAFTYVATAEVIALLQLTPIMVDVDPNTFNLTVEIFEKAITPKTKAVVPVHLFGQCSDMESIMDLAKKHNIYVIEDNAQAIGADYTFSNGKNQKSGTIGDIGTTSFYPSKNLGAYGDAGAIFTNSDELAAKLRMIANHGQGQRYHHKMIGCNSRLDSIQAAILGVKLKYLKKYSNARQEAAAFYDKAFADEDWMQIPTRQHNSTHVFHQYTLKIKDGYRDALKDYLFAAGIPFGVFYPLPLYEQEAFKQFVPDDLDLPVTEMLCQSVISLPIHTEMDEEILNHISGVVKGMFKTA
ncbi:MAG: DegT/DnrJ/EryC1/StrS family aminotransferase [Saprospiraceae bacterium]|nr:DegT/DnrJ/EryC1/StrS family aminotransferase [Saprospiraceae bacterium]